MLERGPVSTPTNEARIEYAQRVGGTAAGKDWNAPGRTADRMELYRQSLLVNPMFRELSEAALDYLASKARMITFQPGERVVGRGDEIRFIAVVLSGGIRSSVTSVDGYEMTASILQRGSFHGVMGVPEPTACHWDCISFGQTEVVAIYCSDFRAALSQYPDISLMLAKSLNYRLKKAYSLISNATLQNLETRVRRTLVMLVGDPQYRGAKPAHIAITQEALGHFVQCTRPTINKVLKDLEREGVLEVGYGYIRIIDVEALQADIEGEALYVL